MQDYREIELIDCDGVIRDFVGKLNDVYNREYSDKKFYGKITSYDLSLFYPIGKEINNFYAEIHAKEIYTRAEVMPGAIEFLNELMKHKKVYIFTRQPSKQAEKYTEEWVDVNKIPHDSLLFTEDKRLIKAQYLLDDYTNNLKKVSDAKSSIPVCFNQDWNQDWNGPRISYYNKFLEIVKNDKITTQSELETFLSDNIL